MRNTAKSMMAQQQQLRGTAAILVTVLSTFSDSIATLFRVLSLGRRQTAPENATHLKTQVIGCSQNLRFWVCCVFRRFLLKITGYRTSIVRCVAESRIAQICLNEPSTKLGKHHVIRGHRSHRSAVSRHTWQQRRAIWALCWRCSSPCRLFTGVCCVVWPTTMCVCVCVSADGFAKHVFVELFYTW